METLVRPYTRSIIKYCETTTLAEDKERFITKIEKQNEKMIREDGNW